MPIIPHSNCISCFFGPKTRLAPNSGSGKVDLFYAETKELSASYSYLKNYVSKDEHARAGRFHSDKDRETYTTCHAALRLILSKCLKVKPLEIQYKYGINNKPGIAGDPIHFNITHTRESFALAVSSDFYVGIDLEVINRDIDIYSIAKSFFSKKECEYIRKTEIGAKNRFFLLWTRKEALLKALGTGMINNLSEIDVSGRDNLMNLKSFDDIVVDYAFHNLYIYSKKIRNNWLSLAIPRKNAINLYHLNYENIISYLD